MRLAEFVGLAVLVAVIILIVLLALRRSALTRSGGIDLSWREDLGELGRGWVLGQGRYQEGELDLYRSFSPLPMSARQLSRQTLALGERRLPVGTELDLLPLGSVIVRCTDGRREFELAMSDETLTGLRSWLESVPGHVRRPNDPPTGLMSR